MSNALSDAASRAAQRIAQELEDSKALNWVNTNLADIRIKTIILEELSAEPSQAVAWLIIHDVGHGLIEKEVVFQPVDGAIPLCVCPDKK